MTPADDASDARHWCCSLGCLFGVVAVAILAAWYWGRADAG